MRARGERMTDGNGNSEPNRFLDPNELRELKEIVDSRERYESPEIQYPELKAPKPDGVSLEVFNYLQGIIDKEITARKENAARGNDLRLNRTGQVDYLIEDILPIKRALLERDMFPVHQYLVTQTASIEMQLEDVQDEFERKRVQLLEEKTAAVAHLVQREDELNHLISLVFRELKQ